MTSRRRATRPPEGTREVTWVLVQPAELEAWRATRGLTKATLASLVGVSPGTYQNWTSGRTAPPWTRQVRLRALLDAPRPAAPPAPSAAPSAPEGSPAGVKSFAAGEIVSTYLETQGGLDAAALCQLVAEVRRALDGAPAGDGLPGGGVEGVVDGRSRRPARRRGPPPPG